jgi:3-hydroxybutyryl-CoA dehydrogenase
MKIAVIGAGAMGSGIAQAFASTDAYDVLLCDVNDEIVRAALARLKEKIMKAVSRGKMEAVVADKILYHIRGAAISETADRDLIVEAVVEKMEVKKELFASLDSICGSQTMFATNSSSLSITEIGAGLKRPLAGMHFFNPADKMQLVEVIGGLNTPRENIDRIKEVAVEIGKTPVEVSEGPGFIVNRMLIPMINEGIGILAEGLAGAGDIDIAMKLGANHPMGPLALGDLIGLDVCLAIMEVLHTETGEDKYRPHPLLRKMVRGGLLGKKTGKGFFEYAK